MATVSGTTPHGRVPDVRENGDGQHSGRGFQQHSALHATNGHRKCARASFMSTQDKANPVYTER
eukprot:7335666-Pyramimonas_sp.AAC.1